MGGAEGVAHGTEASREILAQLQQLELLRGVGPEALAELLDGSSVREVAEGEWLIREGEQGNEMYVILRGHFEVSVREGSVDELVARRDPGEVVGEMALLGRATRAASVRAATRGRVLEVGRAAFERLLGSPGAAAAIYGASLERERRLASLLARREKLAALGTMAAGLAHELNNPAAALKRSAKELRAANELRDRRAVALFGMGLSEEEMGYALTLGSSAESRFEAERDPAADPMEAEDELLGVLEELGVKEAWQAAAPLADAGWTAADFTAVVEPFAPPARAAAAEWLAADAALRSLLREIALSSEAVSSLVGAVKEYSHLDRAPHGEVDVHRSLENTLAIMRHRLKEAGVVVVREYGAEPATLQGYPSELSQVWTNLIDNAAAAMPGGGRLTLSTSAHTTETGASQVTVEVHDEGEGITEEVRCRLFEPFFTTKGVGEGTGLGLYISKEIVTKRHGGSLSVDSRPGATTFRVTLPRELPPHSPAAPSGASTSSP